MVASAALSNNRNTSVISAVTKPQVLLRLPLGGCLDSLLKEMLQVAWLEVSKHNDGIIFSSKFTDPPNSIHGPGLRGPVVRLGT